MNFKLRPDLEKFLHEQVKRGEYGDASGVVNRALEVLQEQLGEADDLRQEAAIGVEQAERGEFAEFTAEDIKAEGRRLLAARDARGSGRRRSAKRA
jgi:putative addiction module CopG family antidote